MGSNRLGLTVVHGLPASGVPPERVAFSLVHARERIDVPISAIGGIEVQTLTLCEGGKLWTCESPHVAVLIAAAVRERIYRLTRQIVDEPLEIVVGGECICTPVVREPLGVQPTLRISAYDLADAEDIARRLRTRWRRVELRLIQ